MTLPSTMRAAVVSGYGGPERVHVKSVPVPRLKRDEVLIRTRTTTVNSGDARMRGLTVPFAMGLIMRLVIGITAPRQPIFGTELCGTIVALGPDVKGWEIGQEVVAFPGTAFKAHAEYVAVSTRRPIVEKPPTLSDAEAAGLCFGGTTALHFLGKAKLAPGQKILVIGASGSVGSAMVQLAAHHFGADVTAVTSTANCALGSELGAARVIDYTTTDYLAAPERYDVIADCVGVTTFDACFVRLAPGGRYCAVSGGLGEMMSRGRDGRTVIAGMAAERRQDVALLAQLAQEGRYRVLVDRVFPLDEIASAHARVDTGHKRGSVVVTMAD